MVDVMEDMVNDANNTPFPFDSHDVIRQNCRHMLNESFNSFVDKEVKRQKLPMLYTMLQKMILNL